MVLIYFYNRYSLTLHIPHKCYLGENNIHNICKYINVISSLDLSFLSKLPKTSLELLVTNLTLQNPALELVSVAYVFFIYQPKTSLKHCEQLYYLIDSFLAHSPTLSTCLFLPTPHPQVSEH